MAATNLLQVKKTIALVALCLFTQTVNAGCRGIFKAVNDATYYVYGKSNQFLEKPIVRQLTTFSNPADADKGGSGSNHHPSLMGVSYNPGHGPISQLIPPVGRLAGKMNGKFTPLTWVGKDGKRYDFDPVQGVYQWATSKTSEGRKEFSMLGSFPNMIDGSRIRFMLFSGLAMGGAQALRTHKDKEDIEQAREEYPFLQDFSKSQMPENASIDPNEFSARIIKDMGTSVDRYVEVQKKYDRVEGDNVGFAKAVSNEVKKLKKLIGNDPTASDGLLEIVAIRNLMLHLEEYPKGVRKNIETNVMVTFDISQRKDGKAEATYENPSLWKVTDLLLTDICTFKEKGCGIKKTGPLGSSLDKWNNDQPFGLSFQDAGHVEAINKIIESQIERNVELQQAQQNFLAKTTMVDPNSLALSVAAQKHRADDKKYVRNLEMGYAFYKSQLEMMKIVGVFAGKEEGSQWRPLNNQEQEEIIKEQLEKLK